MAQTLKDTVGDMNQDIGKLIERTDSHSKKLEEVSALSPMMQILTEQLNILMDKRSEDSKLVHKHEFAIKVLHEGQDKTNKLLQKILTRLAYAFGIMCGAILVSGDGLENLKILIGMGGKL